MNNSFLQNHHTVFSKKLNTLMALATPRCTKANQHPISLLESTWYSAKLQAIDFDGIRKKWYPHQKLSQTKNVPCSVDALIFERKGTYLIEFKSETTEQGNLIRKIYDSIMMLIENDTYKYTFDISRKECTYIVVSNDLTSWQQYKINARAYIYKKEPWNESQIKSFYDHWKLCNLEGVLISCFYAMPPDMFEYFVKYERWN